MENTHICRQQSPVPLAPLCPAPHGADSLKSCNVLCAIFCVIKLLLATSASRGRGRGEIFLNYGSMGQSQGLQPAGCLLCVLCAVGSVMVCFESGLINFDLATPKCEGHPRSLRFLADSCGSGATYIVWHCNVAMSVFDFHSCCMFSWHSMRH